MASAVKISENARTVTGVVVSDRMQKTIVVRCERRVRHPVYGKYITRSSQFCAHDEHNECKPGDRVVIAEVRPMSRRKSWMLLRREGAVKTGGADEVTAERPTAKEKAARKNSVRAGAKGAK